MKNYSEVVSISNLFQKYSVIYCIVILKVVSSEWGFVMLHFVQRYKTN